MWYVLQTMTGREEELVSLVKKLVPPACHAGCFVPYHERVWRRQGRSIVHVERLFPGYVLVISDDPDGLYMALKRVPAMSRLLSDGEFSFLALEAGEEAFLGSLLQGDGIVRLSYVETDGKGHVRRVSGPLENYMGQVLRYQFKKRYAVIQFRMLGVEKTAALGIILQEDVQQELAYGKVEAPVTVPGFYQMGGRGLEDLFMPGDYVKVTSGALEGLEGVVWKAGRDEVELGVRMFGQDVAVGVPVGEVCKA